MLLFIGGWISGIISLALFAKHWVKNKKKFMEDEKMELKSISITKQAFDSAVAKEASKLMSMGADVGRSIAAMMVAARNSINAHELWVKMSEKYKATADDPDVVILTEKEFCDCVMEVFADNVEELSDKAGRMKAICLNSAFFSFVDSVWSEINGEKESGEQEDDCSSASRPELRTFGFGGEMQ